MADDLITEALLDKIVQYKKIQAEAKALLLRESVTEKKTFSELLIQKQFITESELLSFLCDEYGFTPVKLSVITVDDSVLSHVKPQFALKYSVMPISKFDNMLTVAMGNPLDLDLIDDLKAITNLRIKPVIAVPSELKMVVQKRYEDVVKRAAGDGNLGLQESKETVEDLIKIVQDSTSDETAGELSDLMRQAQDTPVIKVANLLLIEGIRRRASDVFIEPWEDQIRVRYRVDGLLEEGKSPPLSMGPALVSRFKVMSLLNIAERRMPQDGRFKIKAQNREVDIRVSTLPSSFGEKVCLRILDKKAQTQSLDHLGFSVKELETIKSLVIKPNGLILVTGPTGSGKTTTLYSILKYLDSPEKNITTVEDPVEYQVDGINQVNVREKIGLVFPIVLRSILRQDPDIILIGEIRDAETMDIANKAALTGHLVLSTLHTNDTAGSIIRMINMGIEPYLIASSVLMFTAQRLLRKLCSSCRQRAKLDKKTLKRIGLSPDEKHAIFNPVGCARCRNMGYTGRTVITEILALTPEIKDLVMKRTTGEEIKKCARGQGMTTLRESALQRVICGETSIDEMLRITTGDQDMESDLVRS